MDDDLNTADAIAAIFEMVRECNTYFTPSQPRSKADADYALKVFNELTGVLGILYARKDDALDEDIQELIDLRQEARKQRDFKKSDEIRDALKIRGIILEDTPQGVKWRRES